MSFTAYATGAFDLNGRKVRCALGPSGVVPGAAKREGDGASPAGAWPMQRVLYRADRRPAPQTALPCAPLSPDDGWCDAPDDPAYNQPVKHPYPASAEHLWREDHIYDLIVILGFNDDPVVAGAGSAIFLHLARPGYEPTQGCVALAPADLEELLRLARPGDALVISPDAAP
jgi:L,D-peptidoglycan transpeptidase YkuD (ErfK/YbiS/YcfS/YnhG family)